MMSAMLLWTAVICCFFCHFVAAEDISETAVDNDEVRDNDTPELQVEAIRSPAAQEKVLFHKSPPRQTHSHPQPNSPSNPRPAPPHDYRPGSLHSYRPSASHHHGPIDSNNYGSGYSKYESASSSIYQPSSSSYRPSGRPWGSSSYPRPCKSELTETDLSLLYAVEKLSYRLDYVEERLRTMESLLYVTLTTGINKETKEDSTGRCSGNFTQIGRGRCYFISVDVDRRLDWKSASSFCQDMGGQLAQLEQRGEFQDVTAYIRASQKLHGYSFWLGGLHPGVLWIWSESGQPVTSDTKLWASAISSAADKPCLKLYYMAAGNAGQYKYDGDVCSMTHYFICERHENAASRQASLSLESLCKKHGS